MKQSDKKREVKIKSINTHALNSTSNCEKCRHKEANYNCPCFHEGFETADAENGFNAKEMVKEALAQTKPTPTGKPEGWEKEFSKFWGRIKGCNGCEMEKCKIGAFKSFIRSLLAQAKRVEREKIRDKVTEFAIEDGDKEQEWKGALLYSKIMKFLSELKEDNE